LSKVDFLPLYNSQKVIAMTTLNLEFESLVDACNAGHKKLRKLEEVYQSLKLMDESRNHLIRPIKSLQKNLEIHATQLARLMLDQLPGFHKDPEGLTKAVILRYGGRLKFD